MDASNSRLPAQGPKNNQFVHEEERAKVGFVVSGPQADIASSLRLAARIWGKMPHLLRDQLKELIRRYDLSITGRDVSLIDGRRYVTHAGLIGLARRNRCVGITVHPVKDFCLSICF
jgi:hypothetical protein